MLFCFYDFGKPFENFFSLLFDIDGESFLQNKNSPPPPPTTTTSYQLSTIKLTLF